MKTKNILGLSLLLAGFNFAPLSAHALYVGNYALRPTANPLYYVDQSNLRVDASLDRDEITRDQAVNPTYVVDQSNLRVDATLPRDELYRDLALNLETPMATTGMLRLQSEREHKTDLALADESGQRGYLGVAVINEKGERINEQEMMAPQTQPVIIPKTSMKPKTNATIKTPANVEKPSNVNKTGY